MRSARDAHESPSLNTAAAGGLPGESAAPLFRRVSPGDLVTTTLAVAEGTLSVEALAIWFRQRLRFVE